MKRLLAFLLLLAPFASAQVVVNPGGGGSATSSGSTISGCTSSILYADAGSLLKCDPAAVVNGSVSTAGRSVLTIKDSISASVNEAWVKINGTFPANSTQAQYALWVQTVTNTGAGAVGHTGIRVDMAAGYDGSGPESGITVINNAAGTGANPVTPAGTFGGRFSALGSGAQNNVGALALAASSSTINYGVFGQAISATNTPASNVAGTFIALNSTNPIGVFGALQNVATVPAVTAAGVFSNASTANDNICAYDGTLAACSFAIGDEGNIRHSRTVTAGGTTGNQTINKPVGTVNFAAAATAITVTDSLVAATSIIFTTIRTADATCTAVKSVVPAAGSFVITLNAGCTAETSVGFMVTN